MSCDVVCVRYKKGQLSSAQVDVYGPRETIHLRFKTVENSRAQDGSLLITIQSTRSNVLAPPILSALTGYTLPRAKMDAPGTIGARKKILYRALAALEAYFR